MRPDLLLTLFCRIAMAIFVIASVTNAEAADKRYTLGSLAVGTTPFLVNTAFAKAVNKYVPGSKIQVSAVGAATKHQILVSQRKMDFAMGGAVVHRLMYLQIGPYKKIKNGPDMTTKISSLFAYPIGLYHAVVFESSGIKSFKDIKGKKVFLGPPAGVATRNTIMIVDAMTGYKPNKDFEQVRMGWGPAAQAFQDHKFDVWITVTSAPSPAVSQLALINKIRLLELDKAKFNHSSWKRYFAQPSRIIEEIDPKLYGRNLVNKRPILSTGAIVGMDVRSDMDVDLVYRMMKSFWDHIDEAHGLAASLKNTLTLERAVVGLSGNVHPGALRYYKEKGIRVKDVYKLTPADAAKFRSRIKSKK